MFGRKNFASKFFLGRNFESEKQNYGLKKFWFRKNVGSEKILGSKKMLGLKRILGQNKFGSEKILGATISFLVCNVIVDFSVILLVLLLTWVIWTPNNPLNSAKSP